MVNDVFLSPRHRISTPTFRKQFDLTWPTLLHRHRFLITAMGLLAFLCTVYLYFAITLGDTITSSSTRTCSGLQGIQKEACRLELAKSSTSVSHGKLKFF
ncbi:hypothetical protein ACFE04_031914 [Oxalis oulophora]